MIGPTSKPAPNPNQPQLDTKLGLLLYTGHMRFTADNAKEYGRKGARVRAERKQAIALAIAFPPSKPATSPANSEQISGSFSTALDLACMEALAEVRKMIKQGKAPQCSQMARALRDLRETWHLATGKPKPGMLKENGMKPRRDLPSVVSAPVSQNLPQ